MLAKKYHFSYEVIKALSTVQGNGKRIGLYNICMLDREYPICNSELIMEQINAMKKKIKDELDKRPTYVQDDNGKVTSIIRQVTTEFIKDLKLRIIVEGGYKESFYYDEKEGSFSFDLTTIKKIGQISNHIYHLNSFIYNEKEFDLAAICPEYWYGKWSIVKNSL